MIDGVRIYPLERYADERGTVMLMLAEGDPAWGPIGQVYFSTVYQGVVKGWHRHPGRTMRYCCPHGRVKVVLFDERDGSPTRGELNEIFLGPDSYQLIVIPPDIWIGIKGMTDAIVCNVPDRPYSGAYPTESPTNGHIPYDWGIRHG